MRRLLLSALLVVFSVLPAVAEQYLSVTPGVWLQGQSSTIDFSLQGVDVGYSPGWSLGAAIGGAYENGYRLETEVTYRQATPKVGADNSWNVAVLLNLWREVRTETIFTPYFGGGFGGARVHLSSPGMINNSGGGFAYQAGAGVGVRIDPRLTLDIGYRYFGVWDINNSGNVGSVSLNGSSITTGLRFGF